MALEKHDLEDRLSKVKTWHHSMALGHGVVTKGGKPVDLLERELAELCLPPLAGKTVLDVGAWDGFYSFEAERRRAARVMALDHYVWSIDWDAAHRYREQCTKRGETPAPWETVADVWKPDTLPGKAGFDLARDALGSTVEDKAADFMSADLAEIGTFDVVLYLGVLYHIEEPLRALRRLGSVTRGMAVIETEAMEVPGYEDRGLCEFFETDELAGDPTNWWAPNEKALVGMCRAAGFRRVEVIKGGPKKPVDGVSTVLSRMKAPRIKRYRAIIHAYK